jgi:hypothetical protein
MDPLVSLNQLASHFRLPREWLRQEALAGRLPRLRVGRKLLFNVCAVGAVLAERAASSRVEEKKQ